MLAARKRKKSTMSDDGHAHPLVLCRRFATPFYSRIDEPFALVACGNKLFHRRVTENLCHLPVNFFFIENTKSAFKNRKKLIVGKTHQLIALFSELQCIRFFVLNRVLCGWWDSNLSLLYHSTITQLCLYFFRAKTVGQSPRQLN